MTSVVPSLANVGEKTSERRDNSHEADKIEYERVWELDEFSRQIFSPARFPDRQTANYAGGTLRVPRRHVFG
jgi:hypothetical protein